MTPSDKANRQFWAARRASAPSPPRRLSVEEFVSAANERLCADPAHVAGTRFVAKEPPVAGAPSIPTWEGPEDMRPLVQRIYRELTTRFELPVPFRIERV
jgi:hypothetical protein